MAVGFSFYAVSKDIAERQVKKNLKTFVFIQSGALGRWIVPT